MTSSPRPAARRLRRPVVAAVLVLALGGLAGCGGDESPAGAPASSDSPAADPGGASGSATPSGSPTVEVSPTTPAEPPAGTRLVTSDGVTFAVPEAWIEVTGDDATTGRSEGIDAVGAALGQTPKQVRAMMASIDLFVVSGDGPQAGVTQNINVVDSPGIMVDESAMTAGIESVNGVMGEITRETTGLGEVLRGAYRLQVGTTTIHGISLAVPLESGAVSITVSTGSTKASGRLADQVLATLTAA